MRNAGHPGQFRKSPPNLATFGYFWRVNRALKPRIARQTTTAANSDLLVSILNTAFLRPFYVADGGIGTMWVGCLNRL